MLRERAVFRRVGGELVKRERQDLSGRRVEHDFRPNGRDPDVLAPVIGRHFLRHELGKVGALPARSGEEHVRAGERPDAPLDGGDVVLHRFGAGEPHDRLHDGERIARAMVDLAGEQRLMRLRLLVAGHVGGHAAEAHEAAEVIELADGGAAAPALLARSGGGRGTRPDTARPCG